MTERPANRPVRRAILVVALLATVHAALATHSLLQKSLTLDEAVYIPVGALMVQRGDRGENPEQPPFFKMLAGRAMGDAVKLPEKFDPRSFIVENAATVDAWTARARMPIVALSVLMVLGVFALARRLNGDIAALIAATLAAFDPNLLAHGRLVTGDAPLACCTVWMLVAFLRALEKPHFAATALAGVALGLAIGCKFTALIYPPLLLIAGCAHAFAASGRPRRLREWLRAPLAVTTASGLIALVVVWALYGFSVGPTSLGLTLPVPEAWDGVAFLARRVSGEHAFLLGRTSYEGWRSYFVVALLVKSTLPWLLVAAAVVALAIRLRTRPKPATLLVLVFAASLLAALSWQRVDIGLRYVLPVVPLFAVAMGVGAVSLWSSKGVRRAALAALLAAHAAAALAAHPNYIPYFNAISGGPVGGRAWLADSNLDWGQDQKLLARWMRERGVPRLHYATSANVDPAIYGIDFDYMPSPFFNSRGFDEPRFQTCGPRAGWVAVAASARVSAYMKNPDCYRWLDAYAPVARIGNTIDVYSIPPSD